MTSNDFQDQMTVLRRQIITLEWDKNKNQINQAKLEKLDGLKKEMERLKLEINDS